MNWTFPLFRIFGIKVRMHWAMAIFILFYLIIIFLVIIFL